MVAEVKWGERGNLPANEARCDLGLPGRCQRSLRLAVAVQLHVPVA